MKCAILTESIAIRKALVNIANECNFSDVIEEDLFIPLCRWDVFDCIDIFILEWKKPVVICVDVIRKINKMRPKYKIVLVTSDFERDSALINLETICDEIIIRPLDRNKVKEQLLSLV